MSINVHRTSHWSMNSFSGVASKNKPIFPSLRRPSVAQGSSSRLGLCSVCPYANTNCLDLEQVLGMQSQLLHVCATALSCQKTFHRSCLHLALTIFLPPLMTLRFSERLCYRISCLGLNTSWSFVFCTNCWTAVSLLFSIAEGSFPGEGWTVWWYTHSAE